MATAGQVICIRGLAILCGAVTWWLMEASGFGWIGSALAAGAAYLVMTTVFAVALGVYQGCIIRKEMD